MSLKPSQFTPAQKGNLLSFVQQWRYRDDHSPAPFGRVTTIGEKEFGSKSSLEHLNAKGALKVIEVVVGPRGGKEVRYAPTPDGLRLADHIRNNRLKTWR